MNKKKFAYVVILLFFSCHSEDFITEILGLNIQLKEENFKAFEKKVSGEVSFFIQDYQIINNEEALYKINYPKRPSIPDGWKTVKWDSGNNFEGNKLFEIIYKYNYSNDETKKEVLKMIEIINKKGNIYSYSYKIVDETVEGLQLFVLDIKNSKFYEYEFLN